MITKRLRAALILLPKVTSDASLYLILYSCRTPLNDNGWLHDNMMLVDERAAADTLFGEVEAENAWKCLNIKTTSKNNLQSA